MTKNKDDNQLKNEVNPYNLETVIYKGGNNYDKQKYTTR